MLVLSRGRNDKVVFPTLGNQRRDSTSGREQSAARHRRAA